jgi:hypothetical protein
MGKNPDGIFPAGADMVRAAIEFKSCSKTCTPKEKKCPKAGK